MQLNASPINARSVNGAARIAVLAAADVIAGFAAELDVVRTQHFAGDVVASVVGEFEGSAERFAAGDLAIVVAADIAQTVTRSGRGDATLAIDADLFYTRTLYGYGSAEISLSMYAEVGVAFIDGEATLHPLIAEADFARARPGGGHGVIAMLVEMDASAIRRAPMVADPIAVSGTMEASHIHDGVRYVGWYSDAPIEIDAEDAGMLRQAHIGSLDFGIGAASEWRVELPTLAGEASAVLLAQGDFHVRKFFEGAASMAVGGGLDGAVFVRGDGDAAVVIAASGTGYKTTHVVLEGRAVAIDCALDGRITKAIDGGAAVSMELESGLWRVARLMDGAAVIEALGSATGYVNPQAEDDAEQVFTRPAVPREFIRPAVQRDWIRS